MKNKKKNAAYYSSLYARANKLLGQTTPLAHDCGVLCEKACCRGDEKTGMLLFPFEKTALHVLAGEKRRLAVCGGACSRNERPLSCRLFPFFPCVDGRGRVTVALDFRGFDVCPLVQNAGAVRFSRRFLHRVELVGRLLAKDERCFRFLREVTEEIELEKRLRG